MKNLLLVSGLAILTFFISVPKVSAQMDTSSKNHYYELKFGDNMYMSIGGGVNLFMIQDIEGISDSRPLTPGGNIALGKWLTPYVGLRLELTASEFKTWKAETSGYKALYPWYLGVFGDFMWNASNTFGGYNENRVFSIIPFAGISTMALLKDAANGEKHVQFPISAGIKLNFRLSHHVDFFIQDRFIFTTREFDGLQGGNMLEPMMFLSGGFTFKFGQNRFIAYNPYEEQMMINGLNDKINQLRKELDICNTRKCPEVVPTPCPECPACDLTSVVRFKINSAVISREQQVNVFNASEWMKNHPNATVEVVGYADKDTGTPEYNLELSQRRAQIVADELVNTYGVDSNRIKILAKGSAEQPYPDHNDWNRVVLFVNEK
ncbi:MAG: OmpA family protein [Bacteroidales bacterium]|nr:OmpA family protein [Bacteroidales bacterium]